MTIQTLPATASRPSLLAGYSIEMTTKDAGRLHEIATGAGKAVFVPWLPSDQPEDRLAAVAALRQAGLEPVPHLSARRLSSLEALKAQLTQFRDVAAVSRVLLIGGDSARPDGPFYSVSDVLRAVDLGAYGIRTAGIAGHPEGHPVMSPADCIGVLKEKIAYLAAAQVTPEIVTQFSFDPDLVANWIARLRDEGITCDIAVGVPGPAKISTLMGFAARCGVGASSRAVAKYGFSLGKLLGSAGPDRFVDRLAERLDGDAGVRLHFYPFGGFVRTVDWITDYSTRGGAQAL